MSGTRKITAVEYLKSYTGNLKQLMGMIAMDDTRVKTETNGEYRNISAVGQNSRGDLLANYFL